MSHANPPGALASRRELARGDARGDAGSEKDPEEFLWISADIYRKSAPAMIWDGSAHVSIDRAGVPLRHAEVFYRRLTAQ